MTGGVDEALRRLELVHARTGALTHLQGERARAMADRPGPLAGWPVVLKDNILQAGEPCTAGSRILLGYRGAYDAHVVERLEACGAVVVGRAAMDEFGMGSSTEHCAFGPVRNPWNLDCVPGGSSGGSAVAVATGAVPLALGSDTGGSVRQPAAFCGVVGIKPTYGRVSRRGLVAFGSSLDQIGPIARTVREAAVALEVLAGHDPLDATSRAEPVPAWSQATNGPAPRRVGVPRQIDDLDIHPGVRARFSEALVAAGIEPVPVDLPSLADAVACYYILAPAEASANLARFDGVRYGRRADREDLTAMYSDSRSEGFGREVKRRILIGTYVLSAGYVDRYYRRAQGVRARIRRELAGVLATVPALAMPTAPTPAFRLGEKTDPVSMYVTDILTIPASLAGLPAISVPMGLVDGLPVGFQVVGRELDEGTVVSIGAAVERATGGFVRPPLWVGDA